ncbi:MAG: 3-deoxy-7-phosphoheptulonate synthase [Tepidibacillus sp.]
MIVVLKSGVNEEQVSRVSEKIEKMGVLVHVSRGQDLTILGLIGDTQRLDTSKLESIDIVEKVIRVQQPFKLANRLFHPENSIVKIENQQVGGDSFTIIAGPCSVESEEQIMTVAQGVKESGAHMLRGGAYKPRTSPYGFQGLQEEGLQLLKMAKEHTSLPIVTEVISPDLVGVVSEYSDVLQVGARNMQNFQLLKEIGKTNKPVLLKRGASATIEEWLLAAEYILSEGNENVILCERGIRTFEKYTRNTLDLSSIPVVKKLSHLPVIVDPSHAAGKRDWVIPLARAAMAVGADGIIVEVHQQPEIALSDAAQQLTLPMFDDLINDLKKMADVMGRKI